MSEIFTVTDKFRPDSFLNTDYMNPDYRGNWPCQTKQAGPFARKWSDDTLFATIEGTPFTTGWKGTPGSLRIKKFTPEEIPPGEKVWKRGKNSEKWTLQIHCEIKVPMSHYLERNPYIVPLIIAKNEEDAKRLELWWKNG